MNNQDQAAAVEYLGEFHGCLTGDCPHSLQSQCDQELMRAQEDFIAGRLNGIAHERARAENLVKALEELKRYVGPFSANGTEEHLFALATSTLAEYRANEAG